MNLYSLHTVFSDFFSAQYFNIKSAGLVIAGGSAEAQGAIVRGGG